jgi:prepilin peptidase CpaA
MPHPAILLTAAATVLLLYAAIHDLVARTVPNWTSGALALLALPLRIMNGDLAPAAGFALAVLGILVLVWSVRLLGAGDVKLWAAATLLLPPFWRAEYLAFNRIVLLGGGLALIYVALHRLAKLWLAKYPEALSFHPNRHLWQRGIRSELWRLRRGGSLPYAVAISAGMLMTLWSEL